MKKIIILLMLISAGNAWGGVPKGDVMSVEKQIKKFAPVEIKIDSKLLDANQKKVVDELVSAARYMDEIFLRQVWSGNVKLKGELEKVGKKDAPLYDYFMINVGPYDRLEHAKAFIDGVPPKPEGAGFYPDNITKAEFEAWIKNHPKDKEAFESNFTVIKRKGLGFVAVPYSEEYAEFLKPAAEHLKKAASFTDNESLKKFLNSRADAFLSNNYYQSDVDWVRLKDHGIEVVIGPYEVYEDELFGYKAAFEAFITRVDPEESVRLAKVVGFLKELEEHLPVDNQYKGIGRNLSSPIVVAQEIYTAGDSKRGVQTLAFNLPNDETIRKEVGSKKVMLKNVQHAKYDKILVPIAKVMMDPKDVADVDFEAFFTHTLLHEVSHGVGPGEIVKNGKKTTITKELKELHSTIEECKADVLGVYNGVYLIGKDLYPKDFTKKMFPTYLAGIFRSVRFGINEAHGGSNAIQFNYMMEKDGFTYDPKTGLFGVNRDKFMDVIKDLAHELLMIEAKGDYAAAKNFIAKYNVMKPELKGALDKLGSVPVDIKPIFGYK